MQTRSVAFLAALGLSTSFLLASHAADTTQKKQDKKDNKPKVEVPKKLEKDEHVYPKIEPALLIKGHGDWVYNARLTPDQKLLVTSSRDRTLRIWDASTGKEVRLIKDLAAPAVTLALSPGATVATAGGKWNKDKKQWSGEIIIFNLNSGKMISTIQGHAADIEAMAFHPQGALLATASKDESARVWNVDQGTEVHSLQGHAGHVLAIAYSPDGKWLATGGEGKTVKVWDSSTGKEVKSLEGPKRDISTVSFSPDGKSLAAGSHDGTVTLWDTVDFKQSRVLKADDGVTTLAFSPDGAKLATGGWERVVKIWDLKTGQELGGLAGHTAAISSVVFIAAGDKVISASLDDTVRIWAVNSAKPKAEPEKKEEKK